MLPHFLKDTGGGCCSLSFTMSPKVKKKDGRKLAKKDKDSMNESGPKRSGPKAKFGTSSIDNLVLFDKATYDTL